MMASKNNNYNSVIAPLIFFEVLINEYISSNNVGSLEKAQTELES
jgi:hypothetical protein